jgi:two-component system, sensor histidine kinase and response regulator
MDSIGQENWDNSDCQVLVVEDNPLMQQTIESLLLSQNYNVIVSANGEEALEVLDKTSVDVIVCDVMMPKMDGYQLFQNIRKSSRLSHIPFVFLTALDDAVEIERGYNIGIDDYVTKPFNPRELLSIVRGKIVRSRHLKKAEEGRYEKFRKRVIHTLSHEFRTPLVVISTGTELLLDQLVDLDPEKAIKLLSAIQRGGQRLERLVNDFIIVQQIESGAAQKTFDSWGQDVSLAKVCREVEKKFAEINESDLERLTFSKPEELNVSLHVYAPHIAEIVYRLLLNALKFSEPAPVTIDIVCTEHEVVFEVIDQGQGFEVGRLEEATQLFGQLDRQTQEQQGGGLGLPIALRLTEVNRGHLGFHRNEKRGFIATISIPR